MAVLKTNLPKKNPLPNLNSFVRRRNSLSFSEILVAGTEIFHSTLK